MADEPTSEARRRRSLELSGHTITEARGRLDDVIEDLSAAERAGCYCESRRKPCPEHMAYEAGMNDLAERLR